MFYFKKYVAALCCSVLIYTHVLAHGGGLNAQGCHNQTSNNTYHCHGTNTVLNDGTGGVEETDDIDVALILGTLAAAAALIWWISKETNKYSFSSPLHKHSHHELKPLIEVNEDDLSLNRAGIIYKFSF